MANLIFLLAGAGHCEDLYYLFDYGKKGTEQDYLVRKRFIRMIANFAAASNPTPANDPLLQHTIWTPNDLWTEGIHQLNIDTDLKMTINPHHETMSFWTTLFEEKGHPPFNTY